MGGPEGVVFAFGAFGEAGQAAALAQRADTVTPAGEDLVRIGLVADVPNESVVGGVEYLALGVLRLCRKWVFVPKLKLTETRLPRLAVLRC